MNFAMVRYIISWVLRFESAFLLLPGIVGLIYGESGPAFVYPATALLCLICSYLICFRKPKQTELYIREGLVAVSLGWITLSLFGAIPFVLTGDIPFYIDALFETVSGFTTTGASILPDVERLSYSGIFWRSFTHWIGGMGVLVFIMAILPLMGGSSTMNLMRAESPGPSVSKLVPRVKDSARILYLIYMALTLIQAIILLICGLDLFESLTLTFATVGTGGFGIRNNSMAGYSPAVQNVITVFMILCGINFAVYFCLLRKQLKEAFRIEEARWYLGIILAAVGVISLNISHLYSSAGETLRHAFFQVGSIITTTGYSTVDYELWPQLSKTVLLVLMFIGACAGSTGGGIKVSRVLILLKTIKQELILYIHPRQVKRIKLERKSVSPDVIRSANVFMALYFVVLIVSVLLVSVDNLGFTTNFTAVVATLNNIGPGFELVGPAQNFSVYSSFSKCILMVNMLAGRLELFPVMILLFPSCWKKY